MEGVGQDATGRAAKDSDYKMGKGQLGVIVLLPKAHMADRWCWAEGACYAQFPSFDLQPNDAKLAAR
jgi:hypothetical protein